jgi:hypothetical protein
VSTEFVWILVIVVPELSASYQTIVQFADVLKEKLAILKLLVLILVANPTANVLIQRRVWMEHVLILA